MLEKQKVDVFLHEKYASTEGIEMLSLHSKNISSKKNMKILYMGDSSCAKFQRICSMLRKISALSICSNMKQPKYRSKIFFG